MGPVSITSPLTNRSLGPTRSHKPNCRPGYQREVWWTWPGSNRRPPACKAGALPAELHARTRSRPHSKAFAAVPHTHPSQNCHSRARTDVPNRFFISFVPLLLLQSVSVLLRIFPEHLRVSLPESLRANISETGSVLLTNEQLGEKEESRDEREFSWCCSFLWGVWLRGTERRRA